jgi:hypothetical protein
MLATIFIKVIFVVISVEVSNLSSQLCSDFPKYFSWNICPKIHRRIKDISVE